LSADDASRPPERRARLLLEDWAGAILMALLALITFANVIVRYFTSQSFAWTEELSVSLMVMLVMTAGAAAVARDRHVRIETFYEGGSPQRRRLLVALSGLATVGCFLVLAALGGRLAWDDYRFDVTTPGIGLPQWWYTIWLPLLSLVIAFRAMQRLIKALRT
jgi:TRAP-type C4-dicarboxylate transport system permease small subunit